MDLKQRSKHADYKLELAMSSLDKIKILKKKGLKRFSSLLSLKASVDHEKDKLQEVDDWLNKTSVKADVSFKLSELKFKDNDLQDMKLDLALDKKNSNIIVKEAIKIAGFENALIKFSNLAENLKLNYSKATSDEIDLGYEHYFSSVELKDKKKLIEFTPYINNTKLEALVLRDNNLINISKFSLVNKIYDLSVSGIIDTELYTGALKGVNKLKLDGIKAKNINTSGKMNLPWEVKILAKDKIKFSSQLEFDDLNIVSDEFAIEGLNGRVEISEDLSLADGGVEFKYLKGRDPFIRVDYSQLEPYLLDDGALEFSLLRSPSASIGPFIGSVHIEQNLLNVSYFTMKLFDGMQTGKMYFNFNNEDLKFGLLSRVSALNMGALSNKKKDEHRVSMRTALEFDMRKSLLEGQVDIIEIGKEQLFDILDFLDPDHVNEKFEPLRTALSLSYPEYVGVRMNNGFMDLSVKINTLATDINIRAIPLSPIIQQNIGSTLNTLKQVAPKEEKS